MQLRHSLPYSVAIVAGTIAVLAGGAAAYSVSGRYDVSASSQDSPVVAWVLHSTYEASLHRHAGADLPPADLMSLQNIQAGARLYDSTCVACHGAPGQPLSPIGQGLEPAAPALLAATRRNNPKLMFWVIKHGVNMTGMPSFGETQSDQTIWQTAAFLFKARGISAEGYAALTGHARQAFDPRSTEKATPREQIVN